MVSELTTYLQLILQIYTNQCPLSPTKSYVSGCGLLDAIIQPFDFIIIGSGSAGSVLANRLSQNSSVTVLVLESGLPPSNYSTIPINNLHLRFIESAHDWYFKTEAGSYCEGYQQGCIIHQGRGIGGSSLISNMLQYEGYKQDFNNWGSSLWNWNNVSPHLLKIKNLYNSNGAGGYMEVTKPIGNHPTNTKSTFAAQQMGIFTTSQPGNRRGYQSIPVYVKNNTRMNVARGYIAPIITRSNLCIMSNVLVTKLHLVDNNQQKKVQTVEFKIQNLMGYTFNATATKEVIVSAGTINSPKILMLSGIGPANELQSKNITVKIQSEHVGKNLQDHLEFPLHIRMPLNQNFNQNLIAAVGNFCNGVSDQLGYLGDTNHVGYIKSMYNLTFPNLAITKLLFKQNDSILIHFSLNASNYKLAVYQQILNDNVERPLMVLHSTLLKPQSRGYIKLNSTNPFDPPLIYPNFLNVNTTDTSTIMAGVTHVIQLLQTSFYNGFNLSQINTNNCKEKSNNTQEFWKCSILSLARPLGNAGGTCKMGTNVSVSVVNEKLFVHGVSNLRVIDSSVVPEITSGDLVTRNILIAEIGATFISSLWNL